MDAARRANAERDKEISEVVERATKPAELALRRGKELGKEYAKLKRTSETPKIKVVRARPASASPNSRPTSRQSTLSPVVGGSTILVEEEVELKTASDFVNRFYTDRVGRKEKILDKLNKKYLEPMPHVRQPTEVTAEALDRLYTRRPRKEKISEAAARKLYGVPPPKEVKPKDEIEKSVLRLYKETQQKRDEKIAAEDAKWLAERAKKMKVKKVEKHELDAIVGRLGTSTK